MCFDSENFVSEPNFLYKETISNNSDCLSNCNTFDYYISKDDNLILITPYIDITNINNREHEICLINLKDNQIIKRLKGHKDRILNF